MKIINKSRWFRPVVCFATGLIFAASCPAQTVSDELSVKDQFENKLSLRIKEQRMRSKELKNLGFVNDSNKMDVDYDGCIYTIDFLNRAAVALNDLKVECRFFYEEQSVWRAGPISATEDIKYREEEAVKYQEDVFELSLESMSRNKQETPPFIIKSWLLAPGIYFSDGTADKQKSEVLGLWVRIKYKTPDGRTLERDFCEPSSLSSRVTWDGKSI